MTTNCPACQSLQQALERARQDHNAEKERIMRILLDQHQAKHGSPCQTIVIWKDGTRWTTKRGAA